MAIVGGLMVAWIPYTVVRNEQARSWPSAPGVVTRGSVTIRTKSGSSSYYPSIEYAFEVGGREYTGTTFSFGGGDSPSSSDSGATQAYLQTFLDQKPLMVFYEPRDPDRNCLVPIADLNWFLLIGAFVIGLPSGLAGLMLARSGLKKS